MINSSKHDVSIPLFLARKACQWWFASIAEVGMTKEDLALENSLEQRLQVADQFNLTVGAIYLRLTTVNTECLHAQLRDCTELAAMHRVYVPHEFVAVDNTQQVGRVFLQGREWIKNVLTTGQAKVLIVPSLDRIDRRSSRASKFIFKYIYGKRVRFLSVYDRLSLASPS